MTQSSTNLEDRFLAGLDRSVIDLEEMGEILAEARTSGHAEQADAWIN